MRESRQTRAYSLVELAMAVALVGLLLFALYAGFSSGFALVKTTREDLRATQILAQRMETIRLYTWEQITNTTFNPLSFDAYYDPSSSNNSGTLYKCIFQATAATNNSLPATYRDNLKLISLTVFWTNYLGTNKIVRSRQMQTYVAKYGMQDYIYGNVY